MDLRPHIERFRKRFAEVEAALSDPKAFDNPQRAQELSREYARLKELVAQGQAYQKVVADLAENRALLKSEPADSELGQMAKEEVARLEGEEKRLVLEVQRGILPSDPADSRNTIIEIRAGAGGSESARFAADLYRMYTRYAEARGWKVETLDSNPSDLGGFKEIVFEITGQEVFKRLRHESGVHRVQRVNTTDSAVQIQHKPTGLIVRCADERSQIKNRAKAMTVLRSRLLEAKIAEENAQYAAFRKDQIGSGERNEKIRTYNFPQNRVTDHRIEVTLYNLASVIDGDLDSLIEPLIAHSLEERLEALKQ